MKKLFLVTFIAMNISAIASAANPATGLNSVYIQQIGNSNVITIEQVGGTNRVGGVTNTTPTSVDASGITTLSPSAPSSNNYGTITGTANTLSITQHGIGNSAQYNIQGGHTTYSSSVTGDGNQTSLTIGDQNHATNNYNSVNETILGNTNLILTSIVGNSNTLNTSLTGNSNQVTQTVTTSQGSISNTVTGDSNVFNIQQTDSAGANGHLLVMVTNGSYNSITTQQQGNNDTTVNINTAGNNNTVTVRTSSNAIINPATAIAR